MGFSKQYAGDSDYLEHHLQTYIDELGLFETELPTLSLKGNDLLQQTQENIDSQEPKVTQPSILPDEKISKR